MKWSELIAQVSTTSGLDPQLIRDVLGVAMEVSVAALARGEEVNLRRLGTLKTTWRAQQVVRSIHHERRMLIGGRYTVRFQPSRGLKQQVAARTPQHWRSEAHQSAWRLAETLISDLAMYHRERAPRDLDPELPDAQVDARCRAAFGALWDGARRALGQGVPEQVRAEVDYLAQAARRRWAA